MRPLDILEHFNKDDGSFAFIATYEFDPLFFERRLLSLRSFGSAERLIVFMDAGRYQELLSGRLQASGFNRRYLVVPVSRAPGAFHPKLYLTLGEKRATGLVGSSNCTGAGIAYNYEICSAFSIDASKPSVGDREAQSVLRQIYETMKNFAADAGTLRNFFEEEFFGAIEDQYPWLNRKVLIPRSDITLMHSHGSSLWAQIEEKIGHLDILNVAVISPFYDGNLAFLERLHARWPSASITIVAQPEYATLNADMLSATLRSTACKLLAATPQPGRRLHAKAFAFETRDETYWLAGSANATCAAFDGINTEASLFFATHENASYLLDASGIEMRPVEPSEFKRGHEEDAPASRAGAGPLRLNSAILTVDGKLECTVETPEGFRNLSIRVKNPTEALALFALPLHQRVGNTGVVDLTDIQISQIQGAAVCEVKGTSGSGEEFTSNPVALIQLYHLLRERPSARGARNPLRKIEETGENLIEYVDSLGSVRDAVEFFKNTNIRFFDAAPGPDISRRTFWKPRDPFKPDTPATWLTVPIGGTDLELRNAIDEFVKRHQREKLFKHVRRGNVNGLPNFLDIFRTLNGLLFTYNCRILGSKPIIPFGFVTSHVMRNLELLMGPYERHDDTYDGDGFVAALYQNVAGEVDLVRQRLREERVPEMLRAAVEAMVGVRSRARKMATPDTWTLGRLHWVSKWIANQGLEQPTAEQVRAAGMEYLPEARAA